MTMCDVVIMSCLLLYYLLFSTLGKFKKSTYAKLKVAFNNMHRRILGYNKWDSASKMFVSNAIDNFDQSRKSRAEQVFNYDVIFPKWQVPKFSKTE